MRLEAVANNSTVVTGCIIVRPMLAPRRAAATKAAVGLIALALLAHIRALWGGWIWDDDANVTNCAPVLAWNGLARIWLSPAAIQQYYPIVHTSFWIEHKLWGLHPLGFHATNVLLHTLNTFLVWRVLRRLGLSPAAAWIAGALFAVHPVHVESVAWVTERKNTLSFTFFAGSALWWLRWAGLAEDDRSGAGSPRVWAISCALFLLALLAKSATAPLPIVLLILAWWKRGRWDRRELWLLPYFAASIALGVLTIHLERENVGTVTLHGLLQGDQRFLVAARALTFYAAKLVWPVNLSFIYPRWKADPQALTSWLFVAGVLALLITLHAARRRVGRGPLAATLAWSAILAPVLGFVDLYFHRFSFVSDHFQYHASPAAFALVGTGLARAGAAGRSRIAWIGVALLLLGLAASSVARIGVFHDDDVLWADTLHRNPNAWIAWNNLGRKALDSGHLDEAEDLLRRAIAADSTSHEAWNNLGACSLARGRPAASVPAFERAIALHQADITATENLGRALLLSGQLSRAEQVLRKAVAMPFHGPEPEVDLVETLARTGQAEEAERACRASRTSYPLDPRFDLLLATLLRRRGAIDEAARVLEHAATSTGRRDPVVLDAWASTLASQGRLADAARIEEEALALAPGSRIEAVLRARYEAFRRASGR
jgi:protein O-mannosyl-transferase